MYEAVCADCKDHCEVPFRPSPDRAIYCKPCFAKRKASGNMNNNRPQPPAPSQPSAAPQKSDKPEKAAKAPKKAAAKKSKGKK